MTDDNYDVAFSLLKEEFLDVPYIVDESFKPLLFSSPSFKLDLMGYEHMLMNVML